MIPVFPSTTKLFEEKNCNIMRFDKIFYDVISAVNEGYFTIPEKEDMVYLFVVGGKPYASGRIEKEGLSFLDIQEFFDTYSRIGAADLAFYKVEKKLLLGLLVYFKKRPLQKLNDDVVDMEKVLNGLKAKGADSMIVTMCGNKMGFCICLKGSPSFSYLPDGAYAQEQPKDGLLLYIYGEKKHALSIEIFEDIQMKPAPDAIPDKDQLPKSLIGHYKKKLPAQVSVNGAGVILMLADKVINKYTITKAETTIGKSAGSDILIENSGVSKHHVVILEKNGNFTIEDKGSAQGTFINREKITSRELKDGDCVQILNYRLLFSGPPSKKEVIGEKVVLLEQPVIQPQAKPHNYTPVESSINPEEKLKPSGSHSRLVLEGGKEFFLQSTVMTIGSNEDMGLRLEGRGVAEHQASILRGNGGKFILVHKGGRTPTKINGNKIEQHPLKNGDAIEIGQYKISYQTS